MALEAAEGVPLSQVHRLPAYSHLAEPEHQVRLLNQLTTGELAAAEKHIESVWGKPRYWNYGPQWNSLTRKQYDTLHWAGALENAPTHGLVNATAPAPLKALLGRRKELHQGMRQSDAFSSLSVDEREYIARAVLDLPSRNLDDAEAVAQQVARIKKEVLDPARKGMRIDEQTVDKMAQELVELKHNAESMHKLGDYNTGGFYAEVGGRQIGEPGGHAAMEATGEGVVADDFYDISVAKPDSAPGSKVVSVSPANLKINASETVAITGHRVKDLDLPSGSLEGGLRAQSTDVTVTTVKRYNPKMLRANPDKVYLFGDNLQGKGKGGQAVIRDEPNAFGIPTKKSPTMKDDAFFNDAEFGQNVAAIDAAFNKIPAGKTIVLPEDGLGTGLAQLKERAPETYRYLQERVNELKKAGAPSSSSIPRLELDDPKVNAIKQALKSSIRAKVEAGKKTFVVGMDDGVGAWAAEEVLALKREIPEIRLIASVAFKGEEKLMSAASQKRYKSLLEQSDGVVVKELYKGKDPDFAWNSRNKFMEGVSGDIIAVYDGRRFGRTKEMIGNVRKRFRDQRVQTIDPNELYRPPAGTQDIDMLAGLSDELRRRTEAASAISEQAIPLADAITGSSPLARVSIKKPGKGAKEEGASELERIRSSMAKQRKIVVDKWDSIWGKSDLE